LTFFPSIRKLKSVFEEIEFLFVFNSLRHSSGKALNRLKVENVQLVKELNVMVPYST